MNEEIKFDLDKDIIMQIEMASYAEYNDTLAMMNDHLGEIYGYSNLKDVEEAQLHYEKDMAYKAIKEVQQENERLKERVAYLERSNNRREDTILGLRQEINDVEDCNDELKKKLDKTLEVLQYELQFQTGGCYHRLSNLFDYLQNGSDTQ